MQDVGVGLVPGGKFLLIGNERRIWSGVHPDVLGKPLLQDVSCHFIAPLGWRSLEWPSGIRSRRIMRHRLSSVDDRSVNGVLEQVLIPDREVPVQPGRHAEVDADNFAFGVRPHIAARIAGVTKSG